MQRGFAPILVLVGILILAIIAGGVYYFGRSQIVKPQPQNPVVVYQTPQPTLAPSSFPDVNPVPNGTGETANWKTYTNTKYGYQVKYPAGEIWYDEENPKHRDLVHSVGINIDIEGESKGAILFLITTWKDLGIKIGGVTNRQKWCELIESQLAKEESGQINCNFGMRFTETTIDNMKAFKTAGGRDNSYVSIFYIPNKGYVYQIEITTGWLSKNGEINFPVANNILSTFKFLPATKGRDQNTVTGPSCGREGGTDPEIPCPSGYKCQPIENVVDAAVCVKE